MTVTLNFEKSSVDSSTRKVLSDISLAVAKSKRIVVVTGAGISCSSGIPDFRSSDGLYSLVKQKYPDAVLKGRDLFDADLFRDPTSTSVFYTFVSELKRSIDAATPSPTHHFIKTLDSKKKLLRSYTQNIDGLEAQAGLLGTSCMDVKTSGKGKAKIKTRDVRNVQLHGDIHRVRCTFCAAEFPCKESHLETFNLGRPPDCPECVARSEARVARSARPLKVGTLRPAIVLYGEPHPLGDDIGCIQTADVARKPDMLIIMGTSLKVHGFKKLIKDFARVVHDSAPSVSSPMKNKNKNMAGKVIFVNRTPPTNEWAGVIDYHVAGDTDKWAAKVLEDWKRMRPTDWEIQQTLIGTEGATMKVVKAATSSGAIKAKAVKRHRPDQENINPIADDSVFTSPLDNASRSPQSSLPTTPTKRPQAASHYCDVESSPSKKRDVTSSAPGLLPEERGLLFGNHTNIQETSQAVKDVKQVKGCRGPVPSSKVRGPAAAPPRIQKTKKGHVWVEIDLTERCRASSRCT